jgi:hypothetical protein
MRGLAGILERKLAGIEDEYRAFLGDAFGPREARALAVGSRACAGRQALVYLASLIGMGDEVTREHQATGARRLIALSVAIGRVGCVTPAEVVCDSIDGMSCDRDTMLQVARAIDDELEDRVRAILLKTVASTQHTSRSTPAMSPWSRSRGSSNSEPRFDEDSGGRTFAPRRGNHRGC